MPFDLKLFTKDSVRRVFSASFWLHAGALAIVAWSLHAVVSAHEAHWKVEPFTR